MKWPCLDVKACQQHKYLFVLYIEKLLKYNINRMRGLIKLSDYFFNLDAGAGEIVTVDLCGSPAFAKGFIEVHKQLFKCHAIEVFTI